MGPDIEWHVGDEANKETIAKTPPPRSSWRGRKVLIVFMVVAAIGLGIVYSSIPGPAPHPTPTLLPPTATPQAIPAKLYETIDREAQALADGELKTFSSLQDQSNGSWFQTQTRTFQAWGRPLTNVGALYTVIESGIPSSDRAWADVRQFRNGHSLRETRFYRRANGQWLRTQPDLSFWRGQQQSFQTQHFDVSYPVEDNAFIQMVAQRFEAAYDRVCADLDCPSDLASIQLTISPFVGLPPGSAREQLDTIVLPSPRISGVYDTVDDETARLLDEPVTQAAYQSLVSILAQILSGGFAQLPSDPTHGGAFFVLGIMYWENNRVSSHPNLSQLLPPPELITNTQLVQLESLWDARPAPSNPEQVASSVILFIEQKFGAPSVGKFLKAIGPARSFKQAIEASLGIDDLAFEQQWKDWLRQLSPSPTPTPKALLRDNPLTQQSRYGRPPAANWPTLIG